MVCYEILSISLTCQMNSVNKCILSHNMLHSPPSCILSHKMHSIPQDAFSSNLYSIPQDHVFYPTRWILHKDLLQQLKSIHFLPSCRLPLHFVLPNSAAIIYIEFRCFLRKPTQKLHRQACASQLPCLYICSSNMTPAEEGGVVSNVMRETHQVSFNFSITPTSSDTWQHLAQVSRVSLQKPQFPHPSTGSRSFEANSLRSSVYLFEALYIYNDPKVRKCGCLTNTFWRWYKLCKLRCVAAHPPSCRPACSTTPKHLTRFKVEKRIKKDHNRE